VRPPLLGLLEGANLRGPGTVSLSISCWREGDIFSFVWHLVHNSSDCMKNVFFWVYKNQVHTSQETHYFSATDSSRLMLCKIWGYGSCENRRFVENCFGCYLLLTFVARRFLSPWWWRQYVSRNFVLTRPTRRNNPKDGILHSHCCESLKSYIALTGWAL
jgi:hypothetical protein